MGGLGETRLSLQVAADVMDDYPDGAEEFTTAEAAGRAVPWDNMLTEARTWLEA